MATEVLIRKEPREKERKEADCRCGYHDAVDLFGALNDFVVDVCCAGDRQREKVEIEEGFMYHERSFQHTQRHLRGSS